MIPVTTTTTTTIIINIIIIIFYPYLHILFLCVVVYKAP